MTNLLKFPNRRRIKEKAVISVVRMDRELNAQESRDLQQWLSESPRHREAFAEAARLWNRMDVLSRLSKIFPLGDFMPRASGLRWQQLAAVASALALIVIIPLLPEDAKRGPQTTEWLVTGNPDTIPTSAYRTVIGEQSLVSLSDGSQIRLNTDSLVEVSYNANSRRVHLIRGEAQFKVTKDASRPFDVWAGSHIVRAVGTSFNVRVSGVPDIEVMVTRGQIRLLNQYAHDPDSAQPARAPAIALTGAVAGQLVTVTSGGEFRVRYLGNDEVADRTAWQSGTLVFRSKPLRTVIKEFSRYTSQRFVLNDESIGDIAVGGLFRTSDVDGFLMALHENFGLKTWVHGDAIMIGRGTDIDAR